MFLQVQDTSASPTLSRLLTAGMNRGSSIKSDRSSNSLELPSNTVGVDSLCAEMNNLMHEFEVVSRIADLVSTLKGSYKVCYEANFKTYSCMIQKQSLYRPGQAERVPRS